MLRWQGMTPEEYERQYPKSLIYSGFVGVKGWVIYSTGAELIYFNIFTTTWKIYSKCNIKLNKQAELPKDTLFYVDYDIERKLQAYAYSPSTDMCVHMSRRNAPGTLWGIHFQINNNSYIADEHFGITGRLHQFNHTDLQWHRVQTHGVDAMGKSPLNCPLVNGNHVYFCCIPANGHTSIVRLDIKSLQWSMAGVIDQSCRAFILCMQGDLMYIWTLHKKCYAINLLTGVSQEVVINGAPLIFIYRYGCFSIDKFFVFPSLCLYKDGSKNCMKIINQVLNTNPSLKDLAIEAVLKYKSDLDNLPQSIQKEIAMIFDPTTKTPIEFPYYELRSAGSSGARFC